MICGADNFFDVSIKDVIDCCLLDKLVGELREVWSSDGCFSRIWLRMLLVPPVQDSSLPHKLNLTLLSSTQRLKYVQTKDEAGSIMAIFCRSFFNKVTVIRFIICRMKEVHSCISLNTRGKCVTNFKLLFKYSNRVGK